MSRFSKEELRSFEFQDAQIMVFPEAVMTYTISVPKELPLQYEYVGMFLEYEYAEGKQGEYGLIAKRNIEKETFHMLEIFSS